MTIWVISILAITNNAAVDIHVHVSCVESLAVELLHHGVCKSPISLENPRLDC